LNSLADNKELIPEFFYDQTFLVNSHDAELGFDHLNRKVNDVELPPWAESPREFVLRNRKSLDSTDITPWINLNFGIFQRGPHA